LHRERGFGDRAGSKLAASHVEEDSLESCSDWLSLSFHFIKGPDCLVTLSKLHGYCEEMYLN